MKRGKDLVMHIGVVLLVALTLVAVLRPAGAQSSGRTLGRLEWANDGGAIVAGPPKFTPGPLVCPVGVRTILIQNAGASSVRLGPVNISGLSGAARGFQLTAGSAVNWDVDTGTVFVEAEVSTDAGVPMNVLCGLP